MTISFFTAGNPPKLHARALGVSLAYGYFYCEDVDEARKQLNLSIGFWWWTLQIQIWREKL